MLFTNWRALLLSFLLGALLVLAFAPFNVWLLAPMCVAGLFVLVVDATPKIVFLRALAFGYGAFGFGVSWVYVSLSTYGGMPLWMGSIAVLGFAGLLAIFIALPCYLVARLLPNSKAKRLIALPLIWVVFEWMQSWVLTGFPWLDVGYTQTHTWLFAWAPIGGVYLVSGVVTLFAASLAWAWEFKSWKPVALALPLLLLSWFMNTLSWSESTGSSINVGVVQANVPINDKWQHSKRRQIIAEYQRLSAELGSTDKLDLVVWPETALPLYMQETDEVFWQNITPPDTALLTGVMDSPSLEASSPSYDESYNAAVLSCQSSTQLYRKRHLVPFGEYLPLRFLFGWVLDYLDLPMSDFSYWQGVQPLHCGEHINIGLSICYEDAFANEYRQNVGGATLLVNVSEDAWFGDSLAPHQRLQMAQMRARELSRPMIRSANSGPSVILDHNGQILAQTPQFEVHTLAHEVDPQTGETPFKRLGNWFIYLCLAILIGLILTSHRKSREL